MSTLWKQSHSYADNNPNIFQSSKILHFRCLVSSASIVEIIILMYTILLLMHLPFFYEEGEFFHMSYNSCGYTSYNVVSTNILLASNDSLYYRAL